MPNLVYTRVQTQERNNITVYRVPDFDNPYSADSSHVHWADILTGIDNDDPSVLDLFDIGNTLMREIVSERLMVANGLIYFDGDEVDSSLSDFVIKLMSDGNPDYQAFLNFIEKLYSNPQEHSRNHLFNYLRKHNISITPDGDLILYKGVYDETHNEKSFYNQKPYRSGSSGPANVSGYEHTKGCVPQAIGDVVSMPRSETWNDPTQTCSTGLHVAGYGYWHTSYHVTLRVLVNPRDVVSVPHDDSKIRCCRYRIVGVAEEPLTSTVNKVEIPEVPSFDPDYVLEVPDQEVNIIVKLAPQTKTKAPSAKELQEVKIKAKSQRKGLVNYMTGLTNGWKLIKGDGSEPSDWEKRS